MSTLRRNDVTIIQYTGNANTRSVITPAPFTSHRARLLVT
jgi:hypothetical protein